MSKLSKSASYEIENIVQSNITLDWDTDPEHPFSEGKDVAIKNQTNQPAGYVGNPSSVMVNTIAPKVIVWTPQHISG